MGAGQENILGREQEEATAFAHKAELIFIIIVTGMWVGDNRLGFNRLYNSSYDEKIIHRKRPRFAKKIVAEIRVERNGDCVWVCDKRIRFGGIYK